MRRRRFFICVRPTSQGRLDEANGNDERKGNTMRNFLRPRRGTFIGAGAAPTGAISRPRRRLLAAATGASLMSALDPALRVGAWAAGSDAPEKTEVKIGFIPLTDCASVVIASVMKFDEKYGIKIVPSKEASWAAVRDKLVNGELDAAHVLYGLVYGVHLGIGGPKKDMAVLCVINTAVGVQRVPQDYLNVARVLNLSEWKIVTKILFPAVLPYMLTGVRLSIGVAW